MERHNPQYAWEEKRREVSYSGQGQNHHLPEPWRSDHCDCDVKRGNINFQCLFQVVERTREAFHTNLGSQDFFLCSPVPPDWFAVQTVSPLQWLPELFRVGGSKTAGTWRWTLHPEPKMRLGGRAHSFLMYLAMCTRTTLLYFASLH